MAEGYIKLHRQLMDSRIWTREPFTRGQAWVDLLLMANHTPKETMVRGIPLVVDRGQVGKSENTLCERWQWSRNKLRKFMSELVQEKMVELIQQKNKLTTLICISNYDRYQLEGTSKSTTKETSKSTTEKHQKVHKQECKEKNLLVVEQIVDDMNRILGTKYRPTTKSIQDLIQSRLNEGFSPEEFSQVVQNCLSRWGGDPKMQPYLRPETMFNGKFQGYLNQPTVTKADKTMEAFKRRIV